jgi:hypothetical protein
VAYSVVLLQDSTAGFAKVVHQADAASYILLQKTFADSDLVVVAPQTSKDYYLEQEPVEFLFSLEDDSGYILLEESSEVPDQIEIAIPLTGVPEETTFTATAYFRTRASKTASVPTTVHYRVDCLTTKTQIQDWTQVTTPAESNAITITSAHNQIIDDAHNNERKQLTVKTDSGLSTQVIKTARWKVRNLQGIT